MNGRCWPREPIRMQQAHRRHRCRLLTSEPPKHVQLPDKGKGRETGTWQLFKVISCMLSTNSSGILICAFTLIQNILQSSAAPICPIRTQYTGQRPQEHVGSVHSSTITRSRLEHGLHACSVSLLWFQQLVIYPAIAVRIKSCSYHNKTFLT